MITRRAFLSALAALPVVGKWMPKPQFELPMAFMIEPTTKAEFSELFQPDEWVPMTVCPEEGGGEIFITNGDQGYVFEIPKKPIVSYRIGDRKDQA